MGNEDLKLKIESWINQEGYPVEFQVAHAFRSAGFDVQSGPYYESDEGVYREIDLTAEMPFSPWGHDYLGKLRFFVECKHAAHPWVLLSCFPTAPSGVVDIFFFPSNKACRDLYSTIFAKDVGGKAEQEKALGDGLLAFPWLDPKVPTAHGITDALTTKKNNNGRDISFETLDKVCSLSWSYIRRIDTLPLASLRAYLMVLPLVVVNGPLFITLFDPNTEKITVKPVTMAKVRWGGPGNNTIAMVVSSIAIQNFASALFKQQVPLLQLLNTAIEIADQLRPSAGPQHPTSNRDR